MYARNNSVFELSREEEILIKEKLMKRYQRI